MAGRILVVDDLSLNRTILKAKLTSVFYLVTTAASGQAALDAIRAEPPELILLDYHLPDMDGLQVCQTVRADPRLRSIPIMLFSASNDRDHRLAALRAGADDFLCKPIDEPYMMGRIRSLLRSYRQFSNMAQIASVQMAMAEAPDSFDRQGSVALVAASVQEASAYLADLRVALPHAQRSCLSLQDALQIAEGQGPDLLILTPGLLDLRGLQIIADLRSRSATSNAHVVVLLPPDKQGMAAMALDLGAADILPVPLDIEESGQRLNMLIRRKATSEAQSRAVAAQLDLAFRDSLTGLPNRRYLDAFLRDMARDARPDSAGLPCAALMVDLDHFKTVNDRFGHVAGDQVLQLAARRMQCVLREGDCIARFGGEEFVIVLPRTSMDQAQTMADLVCDALRQQPYILPGGHALTRLTASVGIAVAPVAASHPDTFSCELIAQADRCLSRAKTEGRDRIIAARAAHA